MDRSSCEGNSQNGYLHVETGLSLFTRQKWSGQLTHGQPSLYQQLTADSYYAAHISTYAVRLSALDTRSAKLLESSNDIGEMADGPRPLTPSDTPVAIARWAIYFRANEPADPTKRSINKKYDRCLGTVDPLIPFPHLLSVVDGVIRGCYEQAYSSRTPCVYRYLPVHLPARCPNENEMINNSSHGKQLSSV